MEFRGMEVIPVAKFYLTKIPVVLAKRTHSYIFGLKIELHEHLQLRLHKFTKPPNSLYFCGIRKFEIYHIAFILQNLIYFIHLLMLYSTSAEDL